MPEGEKPYAFSAMYALGLELSQQLQSWRRQKKQLPQAIGNGTTTRSPTLILPLSTPGPTSSITPMNSWPTMSPGFIAGMNPLNRCRSDPQMHVDVTRTMASRSLMIFGSGTFSTLILPGPHQVTAFIAGLLGRFFFVNLGSPQRRRGRREGGSGWLPGARCACSAR